ncbi:MAG: Hypothetical protein BHV28_04050 [Candidatus Tokpelaia hoelldobleri]|uniref:DUF485 domain-containing protein n=1 Tax=Candidatus Tokpelaia hoelldobleri TaxID=1902579 RepID=A0A1U9JTC6_9HYPH|nr:MAG: Hypothetical protein BHV28_04050 [Candidatus Tokpelaia hoelldoblerii]
MNQEIINRIEADPNYVALRRKRNVLGVSLTMIVMVVYYGWIALIAFDMEFLVRRIGGGVTTLAIPVGLGVLVISVLVTVFYVLRANKTYDGLIEKIAAEVQK